MKEYLRPILILVMKNSNTYEITILIYKISSRDFINTSKKILYFLALDSYLIINSHLVKNYIIQFNTFLKSIYGFSLNNFISNISFLSF